MKIGILTFHETNNFGSYLQTFGLYKKIKDLGYECEVVDYQCKSIIEREIPKPFRFTFNPKKLLIDFFFESAKRRKYKNLLAFLHRNIILSEKTNRENISTIDEKYDKFFVGSDIVWCLDITKNDTVFFLDFVKNSKKKFAFSSSIGNPWSQYEKAVVHPFLSDFSCIAVRETEGADWVEELTNTRPAVVCDPTMLLNYQEWTDLVSNKYKGEKYALVYFPTTENLEAAKVYSKKHRIPCYVINPSIPFKGVVNVNPITIEDFLSLFFNATFVFTGSYHGMLFSIYFNRQFSYYNRAHKSRMNTLAKKLGVHDREGTVYDVLSMKEINYTLVNALVDEYRKDSIEILKRMLDQ